MYVGLVFLLTIRLPGCAGFRRLSACLWHTLALMYHRPCRVKAEYGAPDLVRLTRSRWLETALFTAMAVNPHSP